MTRRAWCMLGLLLATACDRGASPPSGRATTLATSPRAMDRIARLMRAELAAADPLPIERQIRCESARVQRVLGNDFLRRLHSLQDSLRAEFPAERFNQLGQQLERAPSGFGFDPLCRSLEAEAEREAPLSGVGAGPRNDSVP